MAEPNRQKQVSFVLIGGVVLTLLGIAVTLLCSLFGIKNIISVNALIYLGEFGAYCLALYLYRINVSRILWFNHGFLILIFITLAKIILSVFVFYFIVVSNSDIYYYDNGASLFVGLLGSFVRGFLFELPLMGIAARIFETDIFKKHEQDDGRIIDDQLN